VTVHSSAKLKRLPIITLCDIGFPDYARKPDRRADEHRGHIRISDFVHRQNAAPKRIIVGLDPRSLAKWSFAGNWWTKILQMLRLQLEGERRA
jgi:hypothetical protein